MHGAWYNQQKSYGRSYGCPAFHPDEFKSVADALKAGGLFYSFTPEYQSDMNIMLKSIPKWEQVCSK